MEQEAVKTLIDIGTQGLLLWLFIRGGHRTMCFKMIVL